MENHIRLMFNHKSLEHLLITHIKISSTGSQYLKPLPEKRKGIAPRKSSRSGN